LKIQKSESLLYPKFLKIIHKLQTDFFSQTGHKLVILETYRDQDRQDDLYKQGRDTAGQIVTHATRTIHSLGLAVDLIGDTDPYKTGIQGPYAIDFKKLGIMCLQYSGIIWGGNWQDYGHIEMRGPYKSTKQIFEIVDKKGLLYVWSKLEEYYAENYTF